LAGKMILHDRRLIGNAPPTAPNIYVVDATVPIRHCIGWVTTYARSQGGLSELSIMCHGYESYADHRNQVTQNNLVLGFGLQLCLEGLTLYNIQLAASWHGLIQRIVVYSCGPANTRDGYEGSPGDGMRFCGELAMWSGAEVIAGAATQRYSGASATGTINFGAWEGPVYQFNAMNGQPHLLWPGEHP